MVKRIYGRWTAAGKVGVEEDETRCIQEVVPLFETAGHQCKRKRGYGPGGLLCRQHAKSQARAAALTPPGAAP